MNDVIKESQVFRYDNLDGIRSLAALGIIIMHVYANIDYSVNGGGGIDIAIRTMSSFVELFFLISGFSMCCGYYDRIKENRLDLNSFYNRRYIRILPFFALLVLLDLCSTTIFNGLSLGNFYEAFSDLTLMFGLFSTTDITIVSVGWTLGVIFGFYILFPFFVYLIWNKRRAWFTLVLFLVINYVCKKYFDTPWANPMRHLYNFVSGGLFFLYRREIAGLYRRCGKFSGAVGVAIVLLGLAIVYVSKIQFPFKLLVGYSLVIFGAMSAKTAVWFNPVSRFISKISFEIYLAHMMFFRFFERIGLTSIVGNGLASYLLICTAVILCSMLFAFLFKYFEEKFNNWFHARLKRA